MLIRWPLEPSIRKGRECLVGVTQQPPDVGPVEYPFAVERKFGRDTNQIQSAVGQNTDLTRILIAAIPEELDHLDLKALAPRRR